MKEYFEEIEKQVTEAYDLANKAKLKGFDPEDFVDITLAKNVFERVEGLISTVAPQVKGCGISERLIELEKEYGTQDWRVGFVIAHEVAQQKFCKFESEKEAIEVGLRIAMAYLTNGVVASPLEGFSRLEFKKTKEGKDFFSLYFSGPIRSAGTTATCAFVALCDYVRRKMGYAPYDPTHDEIERFVTELSDFHERITNLQYLPSEEEIRLMVSKLPVQINGDPSEKLEVTNYKRLPRVETDRLRNGVCLVIAEGLTQKAAKFWSRFSKWNKDFDMEDWQFMGDFVEKQKQLKSKGKTQEKSDVKIKPDFTFIKDLVAGRPVFTHPMAKGGFRLRYGRARTSGFSSQAIHPATMVVLDNFLAIGSQLKTERPGKATVLAVCDTIEGPIVKLKNGNVAFLETEDAAKQVVKDVEEIIYLGDLLINYGDFLDRGHVLVPAGYNEEWYSAELEKATRGKETNNKVKSLISEVHKTKLTAKESIEISEKYGVPLHPRYTFHWDAINIRQLKTLVELVEKSAINEDKIVMPFTFDMQSDIDADPKRTLELLGVPHILATNEYIVVDGDWAIALKASLTNLRLDKEKVLEALNPGLKIRDKCGTYIGARMGRPEKAKMRKLTGSPQVLFPVGNEGGRLRCFQEALEKGAVTSQFPMYLCPSCNEETVYRSCEVCEVKCKQLFFCAICNKKTENKNCHEKTFSYSKKKLDINHYFNRALLKLETNTYPELIKGVRGTSNEGHVPEQLVKGILRAKHNLYVNKDGTIRYDMTETTITHFKPKEIGTSVQRLKELGYIKDVYGKPLENDEQILVIKPQDIVLPACPDSLEENAAEVLFRVCNFIDELLIKVYNLPPYYKLKNKLDLVGHLALGLSPHTTAAIVCRIIGFSKTQGFYAHPYLHSMMRRDCVHPKTKFVYYDCDKEELLNEDIGAYVENLLKEGAKTSVIDGVGTLKVECKKCLFALGIDPDTRELVYKKIKYFVKGPLTKKWVKVTTATNREYVMTPTHKFMYLSEDSKTFKFKEAIDAKVGDKVAVSDKLNIPIKQKGSIDLVKLFIEKLSDAEKRQILVASESYDFYNFAKSVGKKKLCQILGREITELQRWSKYVTLQDYEKLQLNVGDLKLRCKFSEFELDRHLKITKEFCEMLGYYLSEGYSRTNKWVSQVSFRMFDKKMQDKLINSLNVLFDYKNLKAVDGRITITNKLLYLLLKATGAGKNAYDKRVPSFMFSLNEQNLLSFLASYFEGDGTVNTARNLIAFYSVSHSLLEDIALLLLKLNIVSRYLKTKPRLPGKTVLDIYKRLNKEPKKHVLHHLIISGQDASLLRDHLLKCGTAKKDSLLMIRDSVGRFTKFNNKQVPLISASDYFADYVKKVEIVEDDKNSYCVEIDWKSKEDRNILWGDQIINTRCDGDEAGIMLVMDAFLNFSKKYLPAHRGAKQDEPLVLTSVLTPKEADDMVFNMDVAFKYPLELYEAALAYKGPWEVKIPIVKDLLGSDKQFTDFGFTHDTTDINAGVLCSAYKSIPTMQEKVLGQMAIAEKLRAVDESDVARLVIERHFIRDIRGNLRKFSTQEFRCVKCNEKFRRPPLAGVCDCGGKILFTVAEGSVVKYLEPSLELAKKYDLPAYLKQSLELVKEMVESVFGKDPEKQEGLVKWFG
ncbi:MAG: DNA polymerase II large subunit [Candidatus Nanoarchaeia archaeon]|nr:DNA polymerase II large subunit [Candidatus Nanoarchaeia archaeon]